MRPALITIKLDQVIHKRNQGWQGGAMYGDPMDGAIEHLTTWQADPRIALAITTLRTNLDDVRAWLDHHGIPAVIEDDSNRVRWDDTTRVLITWRPLEADLRVETNTVPFIYRRGAGWDEVQASVDSIHRRPQDTVWTLGYRFEDVILNTLNDEPVPRAIDELKKRIDDPDFAVFVFTSGDLRKTAQWLERYRIPTVVEDDPARMYYRDTSRVLVTDRPVTAQRRVEKGHVTIEFEGDWEPIQARVDGLFQTLVDAHGPEYAAEWADWLASRQGLSPEYVPEAMVRAGVISPDVDQSRLRRAFLRRQSTPEVERLTRVEALWVAYALGDIKRAIREAELTTCYCCGSELDDDGKCELCD
jgi:hypothetical protein